MNFGTLASPVMTPRAGFEGQVAVTLSAQNLATIRYTTNGTTPTASSAAYDGPIA